MTTGCLFCGGDASEPGHFKVCDGRQGQQEDFAGRTRQAEEAFRHGFREGPTATTGEAFELLEATRTRFIEQAREVAAQLCRQHGDTHASAVRAEMAARDLLSPAVRDYWMGCVFRRSQFRWTGKWFLPTNETYQRHLAHAFRPVKVWCLRE